MSYTNCFFVQNYKYWHQIAVHFTLTREVGSSPKITANQHNKASTSQNRMRI
jgi:hypothetical protein